MIYGFVCAPADKDRKKDKCGVLCLFALLHVVANRKRKTGSRNDALTQIWTNIPEIFLLVQLFLIDKRRIKTPNCTRCVKESTKIVPELGRGTVPEEELLLTEARREEASPSGKDGSKHREAGDKTVSRMALTVCGALTEVRGRDVLNNIETPA